MLRDASVTSAAARLDMSSAFNAVDNSDVCAFMILKRVQYASTDFWTSGTVSSSWINKGEAIQLLSDWITTPFDKEQGTNLLGHGITR